MDICTYARQVIYLHVRDLALRLRDTVLLEMTRTKHFCATSLAIALNA